MEPDLCPPYWPLSLAELLHPHHPRPNEKALVSALDSHFAALTITVLASRLGDASVAKQVAGLSGKLVANQIGELHALAG